MRAILFASLILSLCLTSPARAERVVTVFAAASLSDAMSELGAAYSGQTGAKVRFSFASSSTLARQIEAGAPAQIFVSANTRWMDHLQANGLIVSSSRRSPIGNDLVLIAPRDTAQGVLDLSQNASIAARLGPDGWLAAGDPDHVPAGLYAKQALQSLGQWPELEHRLARSDNVRGALALVARGEARLGIVYATDARISEEVSVIATFPQSSHRPIAYAFAIVAGHEDRDVQDVFDFLTGAAGLKILRAHGFKGE